MQFETGYIYHIYNQGNNRQRIFFDRENYLFFLKKMRIYLLPFADILAYCLMPNHFHWMVKVNRLEITQGVTNSSDDFKSSDESDESDTGKQRSINLSIAIMLRSYTRAIQKQERISGSLFKQKTKAECLNCPKGIIPSFYNISAGTQIPIDNPEKEYPQVCFNYIHRNPVKAGLVTDSMDWEFSSARDYAGLRQGSLVNKVIAREYLTNPDSFD